MISIIKKKVNESDFEIFHILLLWAHSWDLEEHKQLSDLMVPNSKKIKIHILGKFPSTIGRISKIESSDFEKSIGRIYSDSHCDVQFLAWDSKAKGLELNGNEIIEFTEHFNYETVSTSEKFKTGNMPQPKLSFFGGLTYERGIGYLLLLALLNPKLKFEISGAGCVDRSVYRPRGYKSKSRTPIHWLIGLVVSMILSLLKNLPNIQLAENYYYLEHKELELSVNNSSFIFYSAKSLGIGSGIVNMALNFGTKILFIPGNSPASELLLKHFPGGRLTLKDFLPLMLSRKIKGLKNQPAPTPPQTKEAFLVDIKGLCSFH
jgi:hypothetical protein